MRLRRAELVAVAVVTAAGICYAGATISAKLAYEQGAAVGTLVSVRFAGSALALLALGQGFGIDWRLPRRRLPGLAGMGAVTLMVALLLFGSVARIPASTATLLLYAYPALVALATFLLGRERFSAGKVGALLLSLVGVTLVLGAPSGRLDPAGVAMALGAALGLAGFIVLAQRAIADIHPLVSSAITLGTAAVLCVPAAAAVGALPLSFSGPAWGWMVAVALLTAAAVSLFLSAVVRLGPTRASIGATVEPVVAVILGVVVLGESLSGLQSLGGALVVVAVAVLPVVERRSVSVRDVPPVGGVESA